MEQLVYFSGIINSVKKHHIMENFEDFKKAFPYRSSFKNTQYSGFDIADFLNLTEHIDKSNMSYSFEYSLAIRFNKEMTAGVYTYWQRSSSFFDQSTVGFKSRKEWMAFKNRCLVKK